MRAIALFAALLLALPAVAQHPQSAGAAEGCALPDPRCGNTAAAAFLPEGTLLVAWAQGGRVWVGRAADGGPAFETVTSINETPLPIDDNGENRPKLAVGADGTVFASFTVRTERQFAGDVLFSRSQDGGRSFEPPRSLADTPKPKSLRFEALGVAPNGRLYAAWIDKRRSGKGYRGASLAMSWSDDGGASFGETVIVQDHTCECCRIALAFDQRGLPVLAWRNIFAPNVRDHAILAFTDPDTPGPANRVSDDAWAVDACPHHGPGLVVTDDGRRHLVWYTQGKRRQGLFYANAEGGGGFSAPRPFGDAAMAAAHPSIAATGNMLAIAWKEFDGERTVVLAITSGDAGTTWSAPLTIAATAGAADHPLLVTSGGMIRLSWLTSDEGHRLLPLEEMR